MKRLLLVFAIVATNAQSHGMYPTGVLKEEYPLTSFHPVKFGISNQYDDRMCYEISINDKIMVPYTTCLNGGERKDLTVYVESKPNTWSVNQVCTLSPVIGTSRTRLCLTSQTYFYR